MPSERSNPRTASDQGEESAYDSLLRRYGGAKLRIEELEAQLEAASTNETAGASREDDKSAPPGQEPSTEVDRLLAKVEALEKRLGVSPEMRLQLHSLANQLAETEALLLEAQGKTRSRRRRSRGTRDRSKWKFWHRWTRRYG